MLWQESQGHIDDLFAGSEPVLQGDQRIGPGSVLLRGFALARVEALLAALEPLLVRAPFRHLLTPGGLRMAVAMSNCGALGWVSDRQGYRYESIDPRSGLHWPEMPADFRALASEAAAAAGYPDFSPDACLINRYLPGTRLSLHQDRDERDFSAPIVSVSLGLPATFLFGGLARTDKVDRILLNHADVMVWGGSDRLRCHGVAPLKAGSHPLLGGQRINLTFRRAG
jgi:alkylated DNA repair protein (DNA oxidative demethylase)